MTVKPTDALKKIIFLKDLINKKNNISQIPNKSLGYLFRTALMEENLCMYFKEWKAVLVVNSPFYFTLSIQYFKEFSLSFVLSFDAYLSFCVYVNSVYPIV